MEHGFEPGAGRGTPPPCDARLRPPFRPPAKEIWNLVLTLEHFDVQLIQPQVQPTEIRAWWEEAAAAIPRQ